MRSNPLVKSADRNVGGLGFGVLKLHDRVRRFIYKRYGHIFGKISLEALQGTVRSIVVIKLCCLGDGILTVPALRALKQRWPESHLTVVCTPRSSAAYDTLSFIDTLEILPLTGHAGLREILKHGWAALPALKRIRAQQPELAVDLDLYFKATPILAYLTGAPVRIGFDTAGANRGALFTEAAPRDAEKWELECFLDVMQLATGPIEDLRLEYNVTDEAILRMQELLERNGIGKTQKYLAMCPGSSKNWPQKQWLPERFAQVAQWARDTYGLVTVLVGAGFERDLSEQVKNLIGQGAVNVAGETSVMETAAILQAAQVMVSNDTGPMHLACAVGSPVVAIFGPTRESKWAPRGENVITVLDETCDCRPCYHLSSMPDCDHRKCLYGITVEQVQTAISSLLTKNLDPGKV